MGNEILFFNWLPLHDKVTFLQCGPGWQNSVFGSRRWYGRNWSNNWRILLRHCGHKNLVLVVDRHFAVLGYFFHQRWMLILCLNWFLLGKRVLFPKVVFNVLLQ